MSTELHHESELKDAFSELAQRAEAGARSVESLTMLQRISNLGKMLCKAGHDFVEKKVQAAQEIGTMGYMYRLHSDKQIVRDQEQPREHKSWVKAEAHKQLASLFGSRTPKGYINPFHNINRFDR